MSFLTRRRFAALSAGALFSTLVATPSLAATGSVRIKVIKGGWWFGGQGGTGSLSLGGRNYGLTVGGVSAGLVFGGSYTEFYAMDFDEDFILMGHDGPGHIKISAGRPVLRGLGLFHGKRGYGLSVEFNVQMGPITILGMTQTADGRLKMLAAEGESIPGSRLEIGNTNSRLRFGLDPATFMDRWCEHGPTHHVALGVGHQLGKIRKLARLLDLELAVVG